MKMNIAKNTRTIYPIGSPSSWIIVMLKKLLLQFQHQLPHLTLEAMDNHTSFPQNLYYLDVIAVAVLIIKQKIAQPYLPPRYQPHHLKRQEPRHCLCHCLDSNVVFLCFSVAWNVLCHHVYNCVTV